jgi:hypothetical protein
VAVVWEDVDSHFARERIGTDRNVCATYQGMSVPPMKETIPKFSSAPSGRNASGLTLPRVPLRCTRGYRPAPLPGRGNDGPLRLEQLDGHEPATLALRRAPFRVLRHF